ncbi:MAG: YggT family protein [Burkholderiaceae bacterium]|jgi:YggT family protein
MVIDLVWVLVKAALSLFALACWLRAYLQWIKLNPLNPLSQTLFSLTNWLVLPLRRFIVGQRFDLASVAAGLLTAWVSVGLWLALQLLSQPEAGMHAMAFVLTALLALVWMLGWTLQAIMVMVIAHALFSWFGAGPNAAMFRAVLEAIMAPLLKPARQLLSRRMGRTTLDLSPLAVLILVQVLLAFHAPLNGQLMRWVLN